MPTIIHFMQWNNQISALLLSFLAVGLMSCSSIKNGGGSSGSHMMKIGLYKEGSSQKVKLELENISSKHLLVANWGIPNLKGEIESNAFKVARCSGENVPYKGIMVSRVGVGIDDVLLLRPGEKVTRSIKLSDYYDLKSVECYMVHYDSCFQYRAFKSAEEVSEFLKKSGNSMSVEQLSSVDCIESSALKFER